MNAVSICSAKHIRGGRRNDSWSSRFHGPQNNVVLLVDPETGNAALQNQSDFDANVDGYSIISSSGSLDAENWRGVKIFRRIATALRAVVCVMTRMDGSADFSG